MARTAACECGAEEQTVDNGITTIYRTTVHLNVTLSNRQFIERDSFSNRQLIKRKFFEREFIERQINYVTDSLSKDSLSNRRSIETSHLI